MKRIKVTGAGVFCALALTACGNDEALTAYQEDMTTFFEQVAACNDGMNAIDVSSGDAASELLDYLDQLRDEIAWMAQLEVPEQFSAVESLADEADENMQQAVELYHQVYESETYDEASAEAAREYYDRANIRLQYIITILHGEIPEGEGVTYTEENSILGGGYLNQTEEEDTEGTSEDNFDTDDTVFYEEPEEDASQESEE
ncbi:MAG: hypothetical protein LUI12_10705 [Clostridiales bacterium]|nr:hypothetical protein [Clostridiales bacterium]